ncbi:MAG: YggS family pyridoxal phosphate-dependent enzyme [Anaerolineae bacterium]
MTTAGDIAQNIAVVRSRLAAACLKVGRDPAGVTLIAVSKTHPAQAVYEAAAAGVRDFGENRVEEGSVKIPEVKQNLDTPLIWHMIGHLQSRKAKEVPPLFDIIHSVDTVKLANKLNESAAALDKPITAFLEINVSGEASKSGFSAFGWEQDKAMLAALCQEVRTIAGLSHLRLRGLMTMAPIVDEMEQTRPVFASLRKLRDALQAELGIALPELSMGMTDDFPVAVEEGATIIRVGRAIFGERQTFIAGG